MSRQSTTHDLPRPLQGRLEGDDLDSQDFIQAPETAPPPAAGLSRSASRGAASPLTPRAGGQAEGWEERLAGLELEVRGLQDQHAQDMEELRARLEAAEVENQGVWQLLQGGGGQQPPQQSPHPPQHSQQQQSRSARP